VSVYSALIFEIIAWQDVRGRASFFGSMGVAMIVPPAVVLLGVGSATAARTREVMTSEVVTFTVQ
jgi:hypothetical protein